VGQDEDGSLEEELHGAGKAPAARPGRTATTARKSWERRARFASVSESEEDSSDTSAEDVSQDSNEEEDFQAPRSLLSARRPRTRRDPILIDDDSLEDFDPERPMRPRKSQRHPSVPPAVRGPSMRPRKSQRISSNAYDYLGPRKRIRL
jgi:hypothetical protein